MKKITLDKPIKALATAGVVGGLLSAAGAANAQGFQLLETTIDDMHEAWGGWANPVDDAVAAEGGSP